MSTRILETDRSAIVDRYRAVRARTEELAAPLSAEDQCAQSMADASPTKWHRAHTTWFFETFILVPELPGYCVHDESFCYLFNSYYNAVGNRHTRAERGLLTRPSCNEVERYRSHVDAAMIEFVENASARTFAVIQPRIELGLHHEQQHQELLLMDIKHALSRNPYAPSYRQAQSSSGNTDYGPGAEARLSDVTATNHGWMHFDGGIVDIGSPSAGFSFDNEGPMHTVLLQPFEVATRLTTAGEYTAFIDDGGYERPDLWLSDGWHTAIREQWSAPLYWERDELGHWTTLTMNGRRRVAVDEPVLHVSHYEADAFARWVDARLPTEFEWECAAADAPVSGNLLQIEAFENSTLHPYPASDSNRTQLFGDAWEWTSSAYLPYPRFKTADGALGEYNGKFMSNQMVLRGGSCFTAADHIRPSYRNFFYPHQRWMASGIRLARDERHQQ